MLGLARQAYYRWLSSPVTDAEPAEAYRAGALFHAHRDDPESGHRFLPDEARAAGEAMAERTAWRICRDNRWWSVFGKRRGRGKKVKADPPVHDDRVRRDFTAEGGTGCGSRTSPTRSPDCINPAVTQLCGSPVHPDLVLDGGVRELERRCDEALFSSSVRLCGPLAREGLAQVPKGSRERAGRGGQADGRPVMAGRVVVLIRR
ncbi:hypothetical protein [Streptomyces sp. NPDC017890]|uniref:hypothetical protein n=1 Tax=Streptomyces sp. NPDC017890 TaxID=3365015 RepID=UPI0037919B4D